MNKLSRKLLTSVLTLAFAFITLGATTFAWFTLQATASIDSVDAEMIAGVGIELSLDGKTWKNNFSNAEIKAAIQNPTSGNFMFDLVTTADGVNFQKLNPETETLEDIESGTGKYIEFYVWVRSPQESNLILTSETSIKSTGDQVITWTPDATTTYRGKALDTSTPIQIYLADTIRMSFTQSTLTKSESTLPTVDAESTKGKVFELDRIKSTETEPNNQRLDLEVNEGDGMIPYYAYKKGTTVLLSSKIVPSLPSKVYNNEHLGTEVILAVETEQNNYYYGYMKVRVWAEGWDPDAFNAIMGGKVSIKFGFKGEALKENEEEI